jgi:hypothetical protein
MKDKVIEAAGRTWQYLGKNGETEVSALAKGLKEKNEVVFQAVGWLAREDKIHYATKNSKTFVSLIDAEAQAFRSLIENSAQNITNASQKKTASKRLAKRI